MSTYVIGDIHACFDPLQQLLKLIDFNPTKDKLIFVGDLINRGPDSVKVLNFVKNLGDSAQTILGNHELSLLALSTGAIEAKPGDTYSAILEQDNKDELLNWLRQLPTLLQVGHGAIVAHAGLYPLWTIEQALACGQELHQALTGNDFVTFMLHLFGQEPVKWSDDLQGWDRLRFIVNSLTRMRYLKPDGSLDLNAKGSPKDNRPKLLPWFEFPNPNWIGTKIIFGHWAALEGQCDVPGIVAIDTGCVWGGALTAYCLENEQRFHIDC